jgi:putative PIN family toxin of toxin-antitoxin system
MALIAVLETNVLISGVGWGGNPERCVQLVREQVITGITCSAILGELAEKLITRVGLTELQSLDVVADLVAILSAVEVTGDLKASPDPDDDMVLECAAVGGATHIVTGDKKHLLPLGSYQGIPIVTPAEFLRIVEESTSGQDS